MTLFSVRLKYNELKIIKDTIVIPVKTGIHKFNNNSKYKKTGFPPARE